MIKLSIAIIVLLVVAVAWLRSQWGRSKNKNASKQIIDDLKSGKYVIESYADSLNIMICTKAAPQQINMARIKQYLHALTDKKTAGKFTIQYADMNDNKKGIVIGEGLVKDIVHNKQMDVFYPCWIYIEVNEDSKEVAFRSTFPENKDHHYLLEDLSGEIYNQCMKN